jgi:STE24 endopeptidase
VSLGFALAFTVPVRRRLDARAVADRPVLLLLVAVVMTGSVFGTIVAASMSRSIEARADREAVAATGDPSAYSDLMIRLAVTNKSTLEPPQWRYALFFTHPTPLQRLAALDAAN